MTSRLRFDRLGIREQKGEALIEFAILAPILLMLLVALVDFGRVFDAWLITTNAAREGARYATIYGAKDYLSSTEVQQLSEQKALDYLNNGFGGRSDVTYSASDVTVSVPSKQPGQPATVAITVRVQIWGLMNIFLSNEATIRGQATMRI